MRPTKKAIIIVLMSGGLLAGCLAASAQEVRTLWKPPPLRPPVDSALPNVPAADKTAENKNSPCGAPDVPLPIPIEPLETGEIQQVGGAVVSPGGNAIATPPLILPQPPPLPVPLLPVPPTVKLDQPVLPKDAKLLVTDPLTTVVPKELPLVDLPLAPLPVVAEPKEKPQEVPIPKILVTDPLVRETQNPAGSKKEPVAVVPEAKKETIITVPTVLSPPPIVAVPPPTIAAPPPAETAAPSPKVQPKEKPRETVKTFVRVRDDSAPPAITTPNLAPPVMAKVVMNPPVGLTQQTANSAPPATNDPNASLVVRHTPELIMEKRGASLLRPGETLQYQIVVRNLSKVPAQRVVVEDELPVGVHLIGADPAPSMEDNKAVWQLSQMDPQSERTLRFTLHAGAVTEILNHTSVYVSAAHLVPDRFKLPALPGVGIGEELSKSIPIPAGYNDYSKTTQTALLQPRANSDALALQVSAPSGVVVGKPAVFDIRITNQSSEAMNGLWLYGYLPEGLDHAEGRTIKGALDVLLHDGLLRPGESKTLKMPTTAVKTGRYAVQVKVATERGHEKMVQTMVDIGADTLQVQSGLTSRLFVGREGEYRIELNNPTNRLLRNVMVENKLAEGVDCVAASDRGLFHGNTRAVHWLIDSLPPGEKKILTMRVFAIKAGEHENIVTARADGLPEMRIAGSLLVETISDLSLKVITRDNPLELGKETVYEIQVANPGSAGATNVQLQVQFPAGMTPRTAQGKTPYAMDRQTVVFEPLAVLGPQGQAKYYVSALAQTAGDLRIRFAVSSDQVRLPITREISTLVHKGN